MTLVADSSIPGEQFSVIDVNSKLPKLYALRRLPLEFSFKKHYSPTATALDSYECSKSVKRRKLNLARDYEGKNGIYGRKGDFTKNVEKPEFSHEACIAVVPLRSRPSNDVKANPEKSHNNTIKIAGQPEKSWVHELEELAAVVADAVDVIANPKKSPNDIVKTAGQLEKSWVHELEELAAVVADARKFINRINCLDYMPKCEEAVQEGNYFEGKSEGDDKEDEVCVLSHEEWRMLPFFQKDDDVKALEVKTNEIIEKSSYKTRRELRNMVEIKCEAEHQEFGDEDLSNHELINMQIGKHDQPQYLKIMEALNLYEEQYNNLLKNRKRNISKYAHIVAGGHVKAMGKDISIEKPFGHVCGIEIGEKFRFRSELKIIGLHPQLHSGIHYVDVCGKICATSIVNSWRYENTTKPDTLIYCGQGGNPELVDNASDQKLEKGNLALVNSKEMGFPIRVIHKRRNVMANRTLGSSEKRNVVYVYDGLYMVNDHWQKRGENGKLVFKFELCRLKDQSRPSDSYSRLRKRRDLCVLNDVSRGREKFMVRVVNGEDDDLPPPFIYITKNVYPDWCQSVDPIGCDCTDCCSGFEECPCVLNNGGEIPFDVNGVRIRERSCIHECGPLCRCPPSCLNRVSQHGIRYQLEIFKTTTKGWGVRSRNYIPIGSFVCEYVGEVLRGMDAEQIIDKDQYLFDIYKGDFVVDAANYGNIGRFINHSCCPNLIAKEVLYDHGDTRKAHIMLFASKGIQQFQELTYDYKYNRVCDAQGNVKTKKCFCGARKCRGKMY